MLVDTPENFVPSRAPRAKRLGRGVYFGGYRLQLVNGCIKSDQVFDDEMRRHLDRNLALQKEGREAIPFDWDNWVSDYGVCDSYDQVIAKWPMLETDPRHFQIWLTEVRKADQDPHGGWRWHKWGPYVGTYEPQHEYLYDEDIERVFPFSVIEVDF